MHSDINFFAVHSKEIDTCICGISKRKWITKYMQRQLQRFSGFIPKLKGIVYSICFFYYLKFSKNCFIVIAMKMKIKKEIPLFVFQPAACSCCQQCFDALQKNKLQLKYSKNVDN